MGNQYTKNEDVGTNISSSDIHNNIRKAFNIDSGKNNLTQDSVGWYDKQKRGKNYVNTDVKRYESFKDMDIRERDKKLNAINGHSDMFIDTPKYNVNDTFMQKNNDIKRTFNDSEITEIKQLKQMIDSKFKDNIDSETSIFDNVSSPDSDINKLKNIIKNQMGGGCGCSGDYFVSPNMSRDINLSILKGGAKKKEDSASSNESPTYNKSSNSSDDNNIDEYEEDAEEDIVYDDNNSDDIEATTDDVEGVTDISRSASRNQIINVTPFYSTETMSASTYFKHLNKNK